MSEHTRRSNSEAFAVVCDVLSDLLRLRSGLSKSEDVEGNWKKEVTLVTKSKWYKDLSDGKTQLIKESATEIGDFEFDRGGDLLGGAAE